MHLIAATMDSRGRKREKNTKFIKRIAEDWLVTNLPSCLMMDILSRLPIKTLFNCRRVCKTWLHLISDPHFAKLQLQKSPLAIFIKTLRLIRKRKRRNEIIPPTQSVQLQLALLTGKNAESRVGVEKLEFNSESKLPSFILINSCNGLLCLISDFFRPRHVRICNPILGEFLSIPLTSDKYYTWESFALGFCDLTNEYKVIKTIDKGYLQEVESEIYTIGKGVWRSLGRAPCMISRPLPINASLNGCIHWINSSRRLLYSFNFSSEQFKLLPLPSVLDLKNFFWVSIMLGILKGCLCVSVTSFKDKQCEMWVMEDYGVEESWAKMLVIETLTLTKYNHFRMCEPIVELDDENILLSYVDGFLVWYNTKTKKFHDAKISKFYKTGSFNIISHTPSFVSLKRLQKKRK